jgi:hypothetical protein
MPQPYCRILKDEQILQFQINNFGGAFMLMALSSPIKTSNRWIWSYTDQRQIQIWIWTLSMELHPKLWFAKRW